MEPPIVEPSMELPPGAKALGPCWCLHPTSRSMECPASGDPKKLKRMKKNLDELNRKIRHSKKRHNGLIHKRNSLRKAVEGLKLGTKPEVLGPRTAEPVPEPDWTFKEHEQVFGGAYRSYRVNGRPKMDVDTFFSQIREALIELIKRELNSLNSARIQTTTWIRFVKDEGPAGMKHPTSGGPGAAQWPLDRVELVLNSRMTNVHQGSDLEQIVDETIAHMKTQIETPALLNSRFRFDEVLFLDINFHRLNLTRGSSYLPLPDWLA